MNRIWIIVTAMRATAIVVLVIASAIAFAGPTPKKAPPGGATTPTPAQQAELTKLEKELTDLQIKQATFAASKAARKLYLATKQIFGENAQQTIMRKQVLAGMLSATGDYTEAEVIYREILAQAEKEHGPDSREVLWAIGPVQSMMWVQNRLDEAEPLVLRQLALTKKLEGEKSQAYAGVLSSYATLLNMRNEYSSAQRLYEQVLQIQESLAKSKDDMALLGPVQVLASVYWQTNQRPKAMKLYDRAIAIASNAPGATVMTTASTMWSVAAMYHYGNRDDLATPITKKVIDMFTKEVARLEQDKPDDPMLSGMLGQLAYTYRQINDLPNAEKALEKAVAIDTKRMGFSGWSGSLAEILRGSGKPKQALAIYEALKADLVKKSPQTAQVYDSTIADVLRELGDYKRAESLLAAYRAYAEKTYGKRHPMYGMTGMTMSYIFMASGNIAQAEKLLTESLDIAEKDLTNVLKTGTESDHAVYFSRNGYQLDTAINFGITYAPKNPSVAKLGLTTLLRRKGRVLDAAAASMATIRSKLSADDKKLLDDLASARTKLAKLTVAGPSATGGDDYAKEVAVLEDQIQKLEIEVGKKSAAYRAVSQPIELAAIQKLVPKDSRLVEIVNFQPYDPKGPYRINPVLAPRHYAAFVLAHAGDPTLVDLGPAQAIDDAIEKFRKAVSNPKNTKVGDLGHALYTLTLAKLVPALGNATDILIAPDGNLNVVPFSALVDDSGELLIKKYTFTYLTSGRDLLRLAVRSKAQGGGVIFADPSFDSAAPPPGGKPQDATSRGRRSADLSSLMWPQLPGTGQEADEVEKTWTGFTEYRGAKATEGALKALHGPKILHLATHGFFLTDEAAPKGDDRGGANQPVVGSYENPLLRSGLAFAGANKLSSGDEDGILTAMEASGLDLWGTKLVVLSACETGNGKVTNGEGVYGLRRALVIAGAEGLVMSLWQVDDLATRDLMAGYYGRLKAGKPRSSALRDIQLEILGRDKYKHPYYWAAFLAAGDNTPLKD